MQDSLTEYISAKQRLLAKLRELELSIRYDRIEEASELLRSLMDQIVTMNELLDKVRREVV